MATTLKALDARQLEARGRARDRKVRVQVIEPQMAYSTLSQSGDGTVYTISRTRAGWECECKGFAFTGSCYHLGAVERRSEREGWSFGRIARHDRLDATRATATALLMGRPA